MSPFDQLIGQGRSATTSIGNVSLMIKKNCRILKIQKNNDVFPLAAEIKRQYKSNEEECN
jgi:hypothetical protein